MALKGQIKQKTGASTSEILHPETDASITLYSNTIGGTSVENVKDALDEIITAGVGVTGVKGNAETDYRVGQVNLTPANIGAVPTTRKVNNKALSSDITLGAGDVGAIPTTAKNAANGVAPLDANSKVPTANLPDFLMGQMIYGGTVNSGGTATLSANAKAKLGLTSATVSLPNTPTDSYEGIYFLGDSSCGTNSTVKGVANFSVGDWLIAAGTSWKKIDNTDAVTSVNGNVGAVNLSGNELKFGSTSDTKTIKAKVEEVEAAIGTAVDALSGANIPYASATDTTTIKDKVDAVASSVKITNATVNGGTAETGKAITALSISDGQLKATKGTFLTAHQSLAEYPKKAVAETITGSWTFEVADATKPSATFKAAGETGYVHVNSDAIAIGATGSGTSTIFSDGYISVYATNKTPQYLNVSDSVTGTVLTTGDIGAHKGQELAKLSDIPSITGKTDKSTLTTKGDMYYASSASTPARLGIGTAGQVLRVSDGIPAWQDLPTDFYVKAIAAGDTLTEQEYADLLSQKMAIQVGDEIAFSDGDDSSGIQFFKMNPHLTHSNIANTFTIGLEFDYYTLNKQSRTFSKGLLGAGDFVVVNNLAYGSDVGPTPNLVTRKAVRDGLDGKVDKLATKPTAGTYSAVQINSEGQVTAGGQLFEVIEHGATPSVVTGGLYFEKAA